MTEENAEQLSTIFKALGDPNRIKILKILMENDREMTCGEVSANLNLSLSTVSHHFKILRHAGLTNTRKAGHEKYLSINKGLLAKLHLYPILEEGSSL